MGITTQFALAAGAASGEHRSFSRSFSRSAASIALASAFALSSASARAGLQKIVPENHDKPQCLFVGLFRGEEVADCPALSQLKQDFAADLRGKTAAIKDPLAADPLARGVLFAEESGVVESPAATLIQVNNAIPTAAVDKSQQPLLIPLPTAISAGLWGLSAVAIFGATKRLRRRLFA